MIGLKPLFKHHDLTMGGIFTISPSSYFLCACWEAFVEDLCREGCNHVLDQIDDPTKIPNKLKAQISDRLKESKNSVDLWQLTGTGWKALVRTRVSERCDGMVGGLNTPNYANVASLMRDIFNIGDIKQKWKWQGMTPDQAAKKLNELVNLRGSLAHGEPIPNKLNIGLCKTYNNHI